MADLTDYTSANASLFREVDSLGILNPGDKYSQGHNDALIKVLAIINDRGFADVAATPTDVDLDVYDAGLLGDGGGGDVEWWQDYIRAELARAYEFYADQVQA